MNSLHEECCSKESVAHWCIILLLSAHKKSVVGSMKAFTTINKSPVFTSLIELLGSHILRLMEESFIYIYIYIYPIGLVGRVFANGPGDLGSIPGQSYQRL